MMKRIQDVSLFALRISLGWIMFYAGITKVLDPDWSAAGYLTNASTFSDLYAALAAPEILPYINILNEWGLTLIGVSLITGTLVRVSAPLGAAMMALYYFPILTFPYAGDHSLLVDNHIVYAIGFVLLAAYNAGVVWGIDTYWHKAKRPTRS